MRQGSDGDVGNAAAGERELDTFYHPSHAAALREIKAFCPDYFSIIEAFGLGDLWQRPAFTAREKELVVLGSLITMGDSEIQLRQHVHTALNRGMRVDEILECIILLSVYVGVPRTLTAIQVVKSELETNS